MPNIFICFTFLLAAFTTGCFGQVPKVRGGTINQFANFPSKYVTARNVDVWLPPYYEAHHTYPIIYMQDGKSLFDSTITWNNQEWGVDETMTSLLHQEKVNECIVVGIWNSGATRRAEYFPQKAFDLLSPTQQNSFYLARNGDRPILEGKVQSDNYLKFIVEELKPFIDSTYHVHSDAQNTFVAGSSYGALLSLYAICEYPTVFGKAACLSTHWTGIYTTTENPIPEAILAYLEVKLPDPKNHHIYFDYGSQTLDTLYKSIQQRADRLMKSKGYTSKNWATKEFIGDDHSEKSWAKRLYIPFTFLLGIKD